MSKKKNLIIFGIDSLRRDHMSLYGYDRLTTPHIDKYAKGGVTFNNPFSPSIPTTPGYASMLTGLDSFGTNTVALRHKGEVLGKTLAELLRENGYTTTNIGFRNAAGRGFDKYIDFAGWGPNETGRSPKAQNLNDVAIPELKRLAAQDQPFFLFMRHMDPHSPYLPPLPFKNIFYNKNETDPNNKSMEPVKNFKPFGDYIMSWLPEGCTDKDYVIAQYDGAIAYMDACIANIFDAIKALGLEEETLVVITSDHGETLYDHDCFFDHHGLYDCTLVVPLVFRCPGVVPENMRIDDYCQLKDVMPTIVDLLEIEHDLKFDGRSLVPLMQGKERTPEPEMYITECTWMRKHGWRTPEWKLICALEPDFHFKPEIELYNLIIDPEENNNVADRYPEVVAFLKDRMEKHIKKREAETGRTAPIYTNLDWAGNGKTPFKSSQEAYDSLYIGSIDTAVKLQKK
ncbi:MAG: sulfatase [Clostridia bacterium]|jgi:arylsulfatase A-like enzyme